MAESGKCPPLLGFTYEKVYPFHGYKGSSKHLMDGTITHKDVVVEDCPNDFDNLYRHYGNAFYIIIGIEPSNRGDYVF